MDIHFLSKDITVVGDCKPKNLNFPLKAWVFGAEKSVGAIFFGGGTIKNEVTL
jgi:hypothetical protein